MNRKIVAYFGIGLVSFFAIFGLLAFFRHYLGLQQRLLSAQAEATAVSATLEAIVTPEVSATPDATVNPEMTAEPFTIAFVSDTETLNRWDDVLEFIAGEGAQMMLHMGDYAEGINPEIMEPATLYNLISEPVLNADGSPTGEFNCDGPLEGIRCILGPEFPVLGAAVGKELPPELEDYFFTHLQQIEQQGGVWGGCIRDGEPGEPGVRMEGCQSGDEFETARAADYWVRWNGITMVFQNMMADPTWVPSVLEEDPNIWKLCLWHGNHTDFQTGSKGAGYDGRDHSLPYEMYKNCADQGALIINGNEHVYSRTCVMEDIGNTKNGPLANPNRVNRKPGTALENHGAICPNAGKPNDVAADTVEELEIGPGKSMVLVSATPGYAWRQYVPSIESLIEQDTYRHDQDGWWATIFAANRYCRNNCTLGDLSGQNPDAFVPGMNPPQKVLEPPDAPWDPFSDGHGVLFITFNYEGNPYKAHGYFKKLFPDPDTGRQIVDEFIITYNPD